METTPETGSADMAERPGDRGPDGRVRPTTFRLTSAELEQLDALVKHDEQERGIESSRNAIVRILIYKAFKALPKKPKK
jgi:hypothetical protein